MMIAGLLFHFVIAFIFTLFFFLIFPKVKLLQGNTIIVAIVYGIFVWAVMNKIVIPYFTKLDPVIFDLKKASCCIYIDYLYWLTCCYCCKKILQGTHLMLYRIIFNSTPTHKAKAYKSATQRKHNSSNTDGYIHLP